MSNLSKINLLKIGFDIAALSLYHWNMATTSDQMPAKSPGIMHPQGVPMPMKKMPKVTPKKKPERK